MSNEIATQEQYKTTFDIAQREQWLKQLNEKPTQTKKQSDYAAIPDQQGGYDTIPIGILENMLDEVYLGLWQTSDLKFQVIANEIVGSLLLEVYDPTARIWVKRQGSGAVTIRQKKDSQLTDIDAKIKTALQMDFPKLQTMCLKSACKTLGKKFGRDLNRKFEDYYEEIYTNEAEVNVIMDELTAKLRDCKTGQELKAVWDTYPQFANNTAAKKLFNSYKGKLTYGQQ